MDLMIASDIHGSALWATKMKELFIKEKCDNLLLLGDLLYHGPRNSLPNEYGTMETADILNSMKDKIIAVRGNCDSEVDEMVLQFDITQKTFILSIDGINFFATHGHIYNETNLPPFANFDVLLNGHTHVPTFNKYENYVFVNPGSVSIPKKDSKHSVIIYRNKTFKFVDLENGNIIMEKCIDESI